MMFDVLMHGKSQVVLHKYWLYCTLVPVVVEVAEAAQIAVICVSHAAVPDTSLGWVVQLDK
jgi:hypothetical protein